MSWHDIVSWNALMFGYADNGAGNLALEIFARMRLEGYVADSRSFVAALKACSMLAEIENGIRVPDGKFVKMECLEKGVTIHCDAVDSGCDSEVFVACTLIDMYAKCGCMARARTVFERMSHHTVVSWNVLILGYAENGEEQIALEQFQQMRGTCPPDARTFVAVLQACSGLASVEEGKHINGKYIKPQTLNIVQNIHRQATNWGLDSSIFISNSLTDMYAKCGSMDNAHRVFDRMRHRDVVSWNSLIYGYVENGEGGKALQLYKRMDCTPSIFTFLAALKACGMVGALESGNEIRDTIRRRHLEDDMSIACSLVDFYGKCGCMAGAQNVFESHATKNLATWTSLIAGYSRQGDAKRVFDHFDGLQGKGLQPDGVTFLCVLAVCNHAGLVEKAKECFEHMRSVYKVTPSISHYHCMIDILGKANALDAVVAMIENMPFKPEIVTWKIVLKSCLRWKNVELAKIAFKFLMGLNDKEGFGYVLLANMYESQAVDEMNMEQSFWTDPAGLVHEFRHVLNTTN